MSGSNEETGTPCGGYPQGWTLGNYAPADHLMNLKGNTQYLNVQARLLWFVSDQRQMIMAGLATVPYTIRTEQVELDRERGFAHFRTYIRDVLGNEATMYGSETARDFGDYAEKASTKSLGRALLVLGYGTAGAQELDEAERLVDAPQERRPPRTRLPQPSTQTRPQAPTQTPPQPSTQPEPEPDGTPTTPTTLSWRGIYARAHAAGVIANQDEWERLCFEMTSKRDARDYDETDKRRIHARVTAVIAQRQRAGDQQQREAVAP